MDGRAESLEEYREWLAEKGERGVKDVRVVSALATLPLPEARPHWSKIRQAVEKELIAHAEENPQEFDSLNGKLTVKGMLVGTAEAAAILGVERPRIGRWRALDASRIEQGLPPAKLPLPIQELAAGPVWLRSQIEAMREATDSRRKQPSMDFRAGVE